MVLQRDTVAPFWGLAAANEEITVTVGLVTGKTKAGAGGQSNMAFVLGNTTDGKAMLPTANHPTIRFFDVNKKASLKPYTDYRD